MFCPNCGEVLRVGAKVCAHCKQPVRLGSTAGPQSAAPPRSDPAAPAAPLHRQNLGTLLGQPPPARPARTLQPSPSERIAPVPVTTKPGGVRALAVYYVLGGFLFLAMAFLFYAVEHDPSAFQESLPSPGQAGLMHFVFKSLTALCVALGILDFIISSGLSGLKPWARNLALGFSWLGVVIGLPLLVAPVAGIPLIVTSFVPIAVLNWDRATVAAFRRPPS